MAALGFFRKNRKLVFWIMVILMVVFLLGIGGIKPLLDLFKPDPGERPAGTWRHGELTEGMVQQAGRDLGYLQEVLGLGQPFRVLSRVHRTVRGEMALILLRRADRAALCWALLTREAKANGFDAGDAAVDDFLTNQLSLNPRDREDFWRRLRKQGILEARVRGAVNDYLCVVQAFEAAAGGLAESDPSLRRLYADISRGMDVAMVEFKASDYVDPAQKPSEEEVLKLFQAAREFFPDDPRGNRHPFRFGYRFPNRVRIEYVFVDWDDVLRTVQPDEDEMFEYWDAHRDEFTKKVLTSQPASQPGTQPASQPAEEEQYETVPIDQYVEAKPLVRQKLRWRGAQTRMIGIAEDLRDSIHRLQRDQGAEGAESPLALAAREALEAGGKVTYKRYPEALGAKQIQADEFLSAARSSGSGPAQDLATVAFNVKPLQPDPARRAAADEIGTVHVMDVSGTRQGKLVWCVVEARTSAVPETITGIRAQVEADVRLQAGYGVAKAKAAEALQQARLVGMDKVAEGAGGEVIAAALSRQALFDSAMIDQRLGAVQWEVSRFDQWASQGRKGPQPALSFPSSWYLMAVMTPPTILTPPPVSSVEAPQTQKFIQAVFAMAPAEDSSDAATQPASQPTSQPSALLTGEPAPADSVMVVELPAQRAVFLVQRVKYTPAYEDQYRQMRGKLLQNRIEAQRHRLALRWYSQEDIIGRTDYADIRP